MSSAHLKSVADSAAFFFLIFLSLRLFSARLIPRRTHLKKSKQEQIEQVIKVKNTNNPPEK
jgi:hypothetical protein